MRFLSAAIFAASCLICVIVGGIIGTVLGNVALREGVVGPNGKLAVMAAIGLAMAFGLLMAMYLVVIRPKRNNALHRLWVVLSRR